MSGRGRPRRLLATAVLVTGLASLAWPAIAGAQEHAVTVDAVGWWTRLPAASVPEGGIAVGAAPDGDVSVGAVRLTAGSGVAGAGLVLVEDGGVGAEAAALRVCPTADPWEPVDGGSLGDAPAPLCELGEVLLERDAEAGEWSGDISSLLAAGRASLVVVPAPAGEGLPPSYHLSFAPPSVEATAAGGGASPSPSPSPSPAPAPSPSPSPAPSGPGFAPATGGGSFATPGAVDPSTPDAGAAADSGDEAAEETAAPRARRRAQAGVLDDRDTKSWSLVAIYVAVAAVVGGAAGFGRRRLHRMGWLGD